MSHILEEVKLETVHADTVASRLRTFAQVRSDFFHSWRDTDIASWDDYWAYCLWEFSATSGGVPIVTPPTRFATQNDMFSFMENNLPSATGVYTYDTSFRILDEVDTKDSYPNLMVHRNSLVASMSGKKRWSRKGQRYFGVASNFNNASYYTNFTNELGQKFVEAATGVVPATNNDDCVWYPRSSKTLWSWPRVPGALVTLASAGQRGSVWDSATASWVTPAPDGAYVVGNPFLLYEYKRNRSLDIHTATGSVRREYELNSVAAQVFPCIDAGRYYGFLVQPHNGDCWVTENYDTNRYDTLLKLSYKGSFSSRYIKIQRWPTGYNNGEQLMWSYFDPSGSGSLLINKVPAAIKSSVNNNAIPTRVYVCRRNKLTGYRSNWTPLYNIKRRLPNAAFRIVPIF